MGKVKNLSRLQVFFLILILFTVPAMFFGDATGVSGDTRYLVNILQAIKIFGIDIMLLLGIICLQLFKR